MHAPAPTGAATLRGVETWRCPHCGTTQADSPRCWACSRHPVACGSCRNFRRAVAGRFGYCGLDRTRATLQGDELRACWQPPLPGEPFEGLFLELSVAPGRAVVDAPPGAWQADQRTDRTRTWAIPVHGAVAAPPSDGSPVRQNESISPRLGTAGQGLVEAPYVPARSIRSAAERLPVHEPALPVLEVHGVPGRAAIGRHDPDGHDPITSGGPGTDESDP